MSVSDFGKKVTNIYIGRYKINIYGTGKLLYHESIGFEIDFTQSNIEGELVTIIQKAKNTYDGILINAAK